MLLGVLGMWCRGVLGSLSPYEDLSPPWEVSQHDDPIPTACVSHSAASPPDLP